MVFGYFSKERQLQRLIKKASNQLSQSPERHAALDRLREEGSEEALYHLLRRFTFTYSKTLEDEQEKEWVVEMMIVKGSAALPPLRRYLKSASQIGYALRILERIADPATILQVIDDLLADEDPGYTRDTNKRIQLLHWLGEWHVVDAATIAQRIIPYLQDFDENTRYATVEALSQRPVPAAAPALVAALLRENEESNRIKVRIAEVLADGALPLGDRQQELAPLLTDLLADFRVQRDKLVRKV